MLGCARAGGLGLGPTFLSRWRPVQKQHADTNTGVVRVLFKLHCITRRQQPAPVSSRETF